MNKVLLIVLVLAVLTGLACAMPQVIITRQRKFPGERRLGTVNYGQYRFGKRGYQRKNHSRKKN